MYIHSLLSFRRLLLVSCCSRLTSLNALPHTHASPHRVCSLETTGRARSVLLPVMIRYVYLRALKAYDMVSLV